MKDNEVPIAYYKTKLTTEIKEIFGIDVRGQTPVLRLKKSEGMPNFVEIPNLTRDIRIGVRVVGANKGMVETPVLAHISVGFRVVKRDPPETLVFKSEHKSERSPVTSVWSVEKAWTLRDLSAWLVVSDRFPTLKEAKQIQSKIHERNDGIQNLEERD